MIKLFQNFNRIKIKVMLIITINISVFDGFDYDVRLIDNL